MIDSNGFWGRRFSERAGNQENTLNRTFYISTRRAQRVRWLRVIGVEKLRVQQGGDTVTR